MTKDEANRILNRLRDGHPMPVALTTQALYATGDIYRVSCRTLCTDGDESKDDRSIEVESKGTEKGFSYSAYLDCRETEGVT